MAFRKSLLSMSMASPVPDNAIAGICRSARGAITGLATTAVATDKATPVVSNNPIRPGTALPPFLTKELLKNS